MEKKIKLIYSFKTPSLLLIILPYFSLHFNELYNSSFFSFINLLTLIFSAISFQLIYTLLYISSKRFFQIIATFLLVFLILLLYGFAIIDIIYKVEFTFSSTLLIRGRILLPTIFIALFLIEFFSLHIKKSGGKVQNTFFILLFIVVSISIFSNVENKPEINSFRSRYQVMSRSPLVNKPIILIITDEYNSPDGLNTFFKDSSVYNFSNYLTKKGWLVKMSFHTSEISTIHSLSSLFNFNLSTDGRYSKMNIESIGSEKLLKATFYDSLKKKNISIINLGIFDIGFSKPFTRLYYYPKNFLDQILLYSCYPIIFKNTGSFEAKGFRNFYFPMEEHNKKLLNLLPDTINHIQTTKTFLYVHLYMPHGPFVFTPEFQNIKSSNNVYLNYWKFTNKKMKILIDSILTKNKEIRIIITGDHGYRGEKKIDPYNTFAAFYGFSKVDIENIKSVQDLGSLINGYYK